MQTALPVEKARPEPPDGRENRPGRGACLLGQVGRRCRTPFLGSGRRRTGLRRPARRGSDRAPRTRRRARRRLRPDPGTGDGVENRRMVLGRERAQVVALAPELLHRLASTRSPRSGRRVVRRRTGAHDVSRRCQQRRLPWAFDTFFKVHATVFRPPYPAWTAIRNAALLNKSALAEMRAVAVVNSGKGARVDRAANLETGSQ
jgi:hypothetical protein